MSKWLAGLGFALTTLYVLLVNHIINGRWHKLLDMDLNAIGDFLAGAFGPIAIFWLILGFFQQGMELRQNNKALKLQAEELRNSVEQQKELVAVTKKQAQDNATALQEERDRRVKGLEPIFAFDSFKHTSTQNGSSTFACSIMNMGSNISGLAVSTNLKHTTLNPSSIPSCLKGVPFKISLTFRENPPHEFSITFKYTTSNGENKTQQFNMILQGTQNRTPCYVLKNSNNNHIVSTSKTV